MVGVIPDNRDPAFHIDPPREVFWETVTRWEQKGWTIGLHGYQHLYVTEESGLVPLNDKSEFAGLPLDEQKQKIRSGWDIFQSHDLVPTVWIAPGHTFDRNTLLALKSETTIRIISDGIAFDSYEQDGFYWIPQQLWRFVRMPFGTYTICLHPNNMKDLAFRRLEQALEKHSRRFVSMADIGLSDRGKNGLEQVFTGLFLLRERLRKR
jgi:predicted deacetylase